MVDKRFSFGGFLVRLTAALILVFATYNPSGYSWFNRFIDTPDKLDPLLILAGLVLLIGWVIYLRATLRSLGIVGTTLAVALFSVLIWLLIDRDILSLEETTLLQYIGLAIVAMIMAIGISWSHIRRRMTGQLDVDDVDE
ncbi:MAG: hypothetical protein GY792_30910 [Gammaproteobacteria bacterium]|nr:hypothetical protein [Gammaproteobacteria bacterium]